MDNVVGNAVDSKVAVVVMVAMVALEHLEEDSGTRSEWMVVEDDGNIVVVVLYWKEQHDGKEEGCDNMAVI